MLHSLWLACCIGLLILILLRVPSQDALGLQSVTITSGTNKFLNSSSQPVDKFIWTLIVLYLLLSVVTFN